MNECLALIEIDVPVANWLLFSKLISVELSSVHNWLSEQHEDSSLLIRSLFSHTYVITKCTFISDSKFLNFPLQKLQNLTLFAKKKVKTVYTVI